MTSVPFSFAQLVSAAPWFPHSHEISAAHTFLNVIASACRDHQRGLTLTINELLHSSSDATHALTARITEQHLPGSHALALSAEHTAAALLRYQTALREITDQGEQLRRRGDEVLADIRSSVHTVQQHPDSIASRYTYEWRSPPAQSSALDTPELAAALRRWQLGTTEIATLEQQWQQCVAQRTTAEQLLLMTLRNTAMGAFLTHHRATSATHSTDIAVAFSGEHQGHYAMSAHAPSTMSQTVRNAAAIATQQLLGNVARSTVWDHPPPPQAVATRWATLTPAQQHLLMNTQPELIGNLPGLPAAIRDQANRAQLQHLSARAALLSNDQLLTLTTLTQLLRADQQARTRANSTADNPPLTLLSLNMAAPMPRVAVAIGNVDTATQLTWAVGGMNNDAPTALPSWHNIAAQLYRAQTAASPTPTEHAVIAWLGYDTPDTVGVLQSAAARTGAPRLAAELDASDFYRASPPAPQAPQHIPDLQPPAALAPPSQATHVHLLAHSYGTTTAAVALTQVQRPVSSFTMLGSAGIDTSDVPQLSRLRVSAIVPGQAAIFSGHASGDGLAPIGAAVSGRALPHHDARLVTHAADSAIPTLSGALSFSVQGNPAQQLAATNGHGLIGAGTYPGLLGITASHGHGYLDAGTQSLDTVARITTGTLTAAHLADFTRVAGSCPVWYQPRSRCGS